MSDISQRTGAVIEVIDAQGRAFSVDAEPGLTLAQAVYLHAAAPPPLCSGLGRCGLCRMRFVVADGRAVPAPLPDEIRILAPEELARGWRLACRHAAHALPPGLVVELPESRAAAARAGDLPPAPQDALSCATGPFRLAVDLGTTSVHWSLLDASGVANSSGNSLGNSPVDAAAIAGGVALNPQMGAGSEIMSRLALGLAKGTGLLRGRVLDLLRGVVRDAPGPVEELCVAGNSAMIHILLDLDLTGLAYAPYALADRCGRSVQLAHDLPPAYIAPLFAPFVGGDLSAGLAWLLWGGEPPAFPFLLADMGTNGEFLLALSKDRVLAASVPLGPALEGIGLTFGRVAGPDGGAAAASFALTPQGLRAVRVDGETGEPVGITGAGYLSLAATLLRAGALSEDGTFDAAPGSPLAARLARSVYEAAGERRFALPGSMYLSGADMEEIAKVKAAFNVACSRLLETAGLAAADLRSVQLAGALGAHVAAADLATLGFVPPGSEKSIKVVGNGSLLGARLLLQRPDLRERVRKLGERVQLVELAGETDFNRRFIDAMVLRHVA